MCDSSRPVVCFVKGASQASGVSQPVTTATTALRVDLLWICMFVQPSALWQMSHSGLSNVTYLRDARLLLHK